MVKLTQIIALSSALLVGYPSFGTYELTEDAKSWILGHQKTKKIMREHSVNFAPAYEYVENEGIEKTIEGESYNDFTDYIANDFARTNLFYSSRIINFYKLMQHIPKEGSLYERTQKYMDDSFFLQETAKICKNNQFDCEKISTTLAAVRISQMKETNHFGTIKLVTGVYFGYHAPKGIGHQWVEENGKILDHSITPFGVQTQKTEGGLYIPVVEHILKVDAKKITPITRVVTVSKDTLQKYEAFVKK